MYLWHLTFQPDPLIKSFPASLLAITTIFIYLKHNTNSLMHMSGFFVGCTLGDYFLDQGPWNFKIAVSSFALGHLIYTHMLVPSQYHNLQSLALALGLIVGTFLSDVHFLLGVYTITLLRLAFISWLHGKPLSAIGLSVFVLSDLFILAKMLKLLPVAPLHTEFLILSLYWLAILLVWLSEVGLVHDNNKTQSKLKNT
eukprot:TRINITY_DN14051_c0_g1_i1.p1 TRINITY_DN14051_c0_g1~~TRINITY_DN14051_c0_g1_i1.p1  ORF type:complete len:220 (+),score=43.42 TRINITY_DN14051_c0_g1_i1:68-661(+)